eukprot:scaffold1884_cov343-Ochromonas_danica.AAC.51
MGFGGIHGIHGICTANSDSMWIPWFRTLGGKKESMESTEFVLQSQYDSMWIPYGFPAALENKS